MLVKVPLVNRRIRWLILSQRVKRTPHYIDVIMTTMASQFTSLTVVYSTVYSDADQSKHQSSASLAFVWPVNSPHKGPVTRKMFPFDDVIMARTAVFYIIEPWIKWSWFAFSVYFQNCVFKMIFYKPYSNVVSLSPDSKVHGAHLGPTGRRWAPCWPHELCYLGHDRGPGPVY